MFGLPWGYESPTQRNHQAHHLRSQTLHKNPKAQEDEIWDFLQYVIKEKENGVNESWCPLDLLGDKSLRRNKLSSWSM